MVPFTLLWHKRNSHNPKIVWLRQAINTTLINSPSSYQKCNRLIKEPSEIEFLARKTCP